MSNTNTMPGDAVAQALYEAMQRSDGFEFPDEWSDLCQSFKATLRAGAAAALAAQPAPDNIRIDFEFEDEELSLVLYGSQRDLRLLKAHLEGLYARTGAPAAGQAALAADDIEEIAAQVGIGMVKGNAPGNELLERFAQRVRAHGIGRAGATGERQC
jgi:hypothetical protein